MKVIIVGGGAAGFFTAINIAERHPEWNLTILEKSNKLLSKVKISGGGRCNVTNGRLKPAELVPFYPRGHKKLYGVFEQFTTSDMRQWLRKRGVATTEEEDLRVFPESNSSHTIIDCFMGLAKTLGIMVKTNCSVQHIHPQNDGWHVMLSTGHRLDCDRLIIATGSSPAAWKIIENTGIEVTPPVPSLFTFKIKDPRISGLMGVSFPHASIKITGTKLQEEGPLLITHWGLSGPAILKLSAWGAPTLHQSNYTFRILINYTGKYSADEVHNHLSQLKTQHPKRKLSNYPLYDLPKRFWNQMLHLCEINMDTPCGELSKKQRNKLVEELTQGLYDVAGKSTFKEEFVTCGGVKLSEVNLKSFQSRKYPSLYLAGEVLDIDALTGGFNFQACWSAGWVIAQHIE